MYVQCNFWIDKFGDGWKDFEKIFHNGPINQVLRKVRFSKIMCYWLMQYFKFFNCAEIVFYEGWNKNVSATGYKNVLGFLNKIKLKLKFK